MQLSLLLFGEIVKFSLMMLMGVLLVKAKLLKSEDSAFLSVVLVYAVLPCVIINAFQVEADAERIRGLLLALAAAVGIHAVFAVALVILGRLFRLNGIEKATLMYSNAANMVIPVVMSVLGPEWVSYTSAYIGFQLILLWTHCKCMICGEKGLEWKKILGNINIIAILIGLALLAGNIRLPSLIASTFTSVGNMVAPLSMIIIGMLLAGADLKAVLTSRRVYLIALLRLLLFPSLIIAFFFVSGLTYVMDHAGEILFVSFLSGITPASSTITQMAQIYKQDAQYAGTLNAVTTILCLVTIPVMAGIYGVVFQVAF